MEKKKRQGPPARRLQTIRGEEIVPLTELEARLGLGPSAIRQARRRGLKIRRIGRRKFLLGRDLLAFLESTS